MKNTFKDVLINWTTTLEEEAKIYFNNTVITLDTSQSKLPHLMGKQYFNQFKQFNSKKFIAAIAKDSINDSHINELEPNTKKMVLNKLKVLKEVKNIISNLIIYSSHYKITKNVSGEYIIFKYNKAKTTIKAFVLKKIERSNIYQPMSCLLLHQSQSIFNTIKESKPFKILKIEKYSPKLMETHAKY